MKRAALLVAFVASLALAQSIQFVRRPDNSDLAGKNQLPAALCGGRLCVDTGGSAPSVVTVDSGTITVNQGLSLDGGTTAWVITCPDGTCSGGGGGGSGGSSVVTVDGGRLGAVDWIDGGYINATILGTPNVAVTALPLISGTVAIDGGGAAGTLGVNVGNFPASTTVSIDGGGAAGTLGVNVNNSVTVTGAILANATVDGGRLGAIDWIDGGYINAAVSGTVGVNNFPATVMASIDGGGAAGTLGVNVNNFPTQYPGTVSIDGGPGGTLGVNVNNTVAVSGTVGVNNFPTTVMASIDGGGAAGTLGVNVGNFPTSYTVAIDGGGAAGTLGVNVNNAVAISNIASGLVTVDGGTVTSIQGGAPWTTTPPTGSVNNDGACISVSTNTTVLASNASRRQAAICARISNSDTTFVKLAASATTSDFPLEPGQCINLTAPGSIYTGIIDAVANSGTQSICVLEVN